PIAGMMAIQYMVGAFEEKKDGDGNGRRTGQSGQSGQTGQVSFSEISFNENSREFAEFVKSVSGAGNSGAQAVSSPSGGQALTPSATPLAITRGAPGPVPPPPPISHA